MNLTDTHSHIYDEAFDEDREQAVRRAVKAGVGKILMPAIDSQTHARLFGTSAAYPRTCIPMMGLHPTSVNDNPRFRAELDLVERYLERPPEGIDGFIAVGEVGLDLHWSRESVTQQIEAFERQIGLAAKHRLPLVIHTRRAWPEMIEILERHKDKGLRGVMHAFSGSLNDHARIKRCGDFMFGIGGVVTFKNSGLSEIVAKIPIGDILLETDCPYLAPVPFRGKRNETGYLTYICRCVADIYGLTAEETARITTENSERMFGLAQAPD